MRPSVKLDLFGSYLGVACAVRIHSGTFASRTIFFRINVDETLRVGASLWSKASDHPACLTVLFRVESAALRHSRNRRNCEHFCSHAFECRGTSGGCRTSRNDVIDQDYRFAFDPGRVYGEGACHVLHAMHLVCADLVGREVDAPKREGKAQKPRQTPKCR